MGKADDILKTTVILVTDRSLPHFSRCQDKETATSCLCLSVGIPFLLACCAAQTAGLKVIPFAKALITLRPCELEFVSMCS